MTTTILVNPVAVMETLIDDHWDRSIPLPKVVKREVGEEALRLELPKEGLVSIYVPTSGTRVKFRGNWKYSDEEVTCELEISTIESYDRLWEIAQELTRLIQVNKTDVKPFHRIKVLSFALRLEEAFKFWKGVLRIQLERFGVYVGG